MPLTEIKVEIPDRTVGSVEEVLLEEGWSSWSVLQDAIGRRAWLVGIFEGRGAAEASWREVAARLPAPPVSPEEIRTLADLDWRDSYKAHFHAWSFGRLHWVPIWEKAGFTLPPGGAVLWLDPGMAFGTGNHETTRLCCERLVALAEPDRPSTGRSSRECEPRASLANSSVIDAGCGSGILALSAARLGFRRVAAFDLDPEAVRVSRENAGLNGLTGAVEFFVADLAGGLAGRKGDVVLANIQADVLGRHASELANAVAPGGTLVLSGILAAELPTVLASFRRFTLGWAQSSRVLGEWSDCCYTSNHA